MPTDSLQFALGEAVFHRSDTEDDDVPGIVTGILFRPSGVVYKVTWNRHEDEGEHYEVELTKEPPKHALKLT